MRICHVTSAHPANDPRIAHKEASSAARAGHEVILVAPDLGFPAPPDINLVTVRRGSSRLRRVLGTALHALAAARKTQAHVYHLHDPELLLWVPLFRVITRGAVVFDVHESVPDQIMSKSWIPASLRPMVSALTRISMRVLAATCSGLVHANPHTVGTLGSRQPEALARNFPVLRPVPRPPRPAEEGARVVYVGAISPIRGSREMLEACLRASEELPLTLSLIGRPEPESHIDELRELPGWRLVDRVERVDHSEVSHILGNADVGLAVLHPVPNYLVSYPTKVFEYVAAGLQVVVSDFPLWREMFAPLASVRYVDPCDVDAIATLVVEAVHASRSGAAAGTDAAAYVMSNLSWAGEYAKIEDLYATVTHRS